MDPQRSGFWLDFLPFSENHKNKNINLIGCEPSKAFCLIHTSSKSYDTVPSVCKATSDIKLKTKFGTYLLC
jgi:hypothetical protein